MTEAIVKGNDYLISRYDGVVIDGRKWDRQGYKSHQSNILYQYAGMESSQEDQNALLKYRNPYGIGNYVNHPAPNQKPNLIQLGYDFPKGEEYSLPKELSYYIPNELYKPSLLYVLMGYMHSVILIANRHIQNEELLLNYRFNPANPYPSWYTQPDEEEAKRRWGYRGFIQA